MVSLVNEDDVPRARGEDVFAAVFAAREVARLSAAGDASGRQVAQRLVGDGARVSISDADDRVVVVEVRSGVAMLPGLTVSARAVAAKEPTGADQVVFAPGVGP